MRGARHLGMMIFSRDTMEHVTGGGPVPIEVPLHAAPECQDAIRTFNTFAKDFHALPDETSQQTSARWAKEYFKIHGHCKGMR
jgi:hypothetical protein